MRTRTLLWPSLAALTLLGASTAAQAHGPSHISAKSLVGTWRVTITPYVCLTGDQIPAAAVRTYMTFDAHGTMMEINSNAQFQPGQRSSGLGFWERTGPRSYRAVYEAFIQFTSVVTPPATPRYVKGTQRVDQGVEFIDRDHWESSGTVTFFDTAGTPVPPSGCAVAQGERMD